MSRYDVTAIINVHAEGLMLVPTLRSVEENVRLAREAGARVNVLLAADRPDAVTNDVLATLSGFDILKMDHGDLGLSRQLAASEAQSTYVCFVDGDDIWAPNWITKAWQTAEHFERQAVWHPACSLYFGTATFIYPHVDMESPEFDLKHLAVDNYWTSAVFARTETVLEVPFLKSSKKDRLGHEDWNWHCRTIAAGYLHKVVPDTMHFIRRRANSMSTEAIQMQSMCLPHTLFAGPAGETAFS